MNSSRRPGILSTAVLALAFAGAAVAQPPDKSQHGQKDKSAKASEKAERKAEKNAAKAEKKAQHHNNGKGMLGDKIKTNGRHKLDQKGDYTTDVDVKDGKIAGVHVNNAKKGAVPVKKYKTNKKMAMLPVVAGAQVASLEPFQGEYMGTTYIGYSYVDDYGNEEIYWFPYDMILDGDTGAIDYVPAY